MDAFLTEAGKAAVNLFLQPLQQKATVSPFSFLAVMPGLALRLVLIGHISLIGGDAAAIPMAGLRALYLAMTSSKMSSAFICE